MLQIVGHEIFDGRVEPNLGEAPVTPAWLLRGPFATEIRALECSYITEHLNAVESPEASLALVRVEPGVTTRLHAVNDVIERYIVLSGEGIVEVGGASAPIVSGDRVIIPPGVAQRVTNTGQDDLVYYELCTPRFRQELYVDLGDRQDE